jgi:ATP-dependent exoDNAse (exonuclease V) beta subunit
LRRRQGPTVHVSLDGGPDEITATAESQGRIFGATVEEVNGAIAAVRAAFEHPLMQRARDAAAKAECYRELPLTLRMDDGVLIEGIADLVFQDQDRWNVVDFKTDQEMATGLNRYRRQVSLYAAAISEARNVESAAYLLRV